MTYLDRTADGRRIVKESTTITPTAAGNSPVTVTMSDLDAVDYIVNVAVDGNGIDGGQPEGTHVGGVGDTNSVGTTLYGVGAGGTVDVTVTAAGN